MTVVIKKGTTMAKQSERPPLIDELIWTMESNLTQLMEQREQETKAYLDSLKAIQAVLDRFINNLEDE